MFHGCMEKIVVKSLFGGIRLEVNNMKRESFQFKT